MAKAPGTFCPLLQKNCIEGKCAWYTKLMGTNKNTGEAIDDYGCAIAWIPMLLVENANEARQTNATVESLRNEHAKGADATRQVLIAGLGLFDDGRPRLTRIDGGRDGP